MLRHGHFVVIPLILGRGVSLCSALQDQNIPFRCCLGAGLLTDSQSTYWKHTAAACHDSCFPSQCTTCREMGQRREKQGVKGRHTWAGTCRVKQSNTSPRGEGPIFSIADPADVVTLVGWTQRAKDQLWQTSCLM